MTFDDLLARINELTAISRERELTLEEKEERQELRQAYLKAFRSSFAKQLESTKIIDPTGQDVTPEKIKQIQREKGLHQRDQEEENE